MDERTVLFQNPYPYSFHMELINEQIKEDEVTQNVRSSTSSHSHTVQCHTESIQRSTAGDSETTDKAKHQENELNTHALVQKANVKEDVLKEVKLKNDDELVIGKVVDAEGKAVKPNPVMAVIEEDQSQGTCQRVTFEALEESKVQQDSPLDQEDLLMCTTKHAEAAISAVSLPESCNETIHQSESVKDTLMVFGVTAKAAAEVLMQFVTDERSIKEKSELGLSNQIALALEEVMDVCKATQENAIAVEHIAVYLTKEIHILYSFYGFLTIFPG